MSALFAFWSESHALVPTLTGLLLIASVVLGLARLWRGPSDWDRLLALDLLVGVALAAMVWLALVLDRPGLLDAAVGLAVVAFIGTVVLARWLQDREGGRS